MRQFTNPNFIVESRVRVETLATIAIWYEKQGETFNSLAGFGRAIMEDFELMITASGENRIVDPIEGMSAMRRLGLRGHKQKRSARGYLSSIQLSELGRAPMYTREDALKEIEKAAEFDEEEAIEKSQRRDQKEKEALAKGPGEETIIKKEE